MKTFRDNQNREWTIAINIGTMRRIRDLTGLDLAGDLTTAMKTLEGDILLLVDVIYVACKPQADEREISDEQFGESFDESVVVEAGQAFLEEFANFFQPAKRRVLTTAMRKATELQQQRATQMPTDEEVEQTVETNWKKTMESGSSSTNSRASSDTTPTT